MNILAFKKISKKYVKRSMSFPEENHQVYIIIELVRPFP